MLPAIIANLGIPFLINLLGGALGKVDNPIAQSAAQALGNFQTAISSGAVTADQLAEANRHAEAMAELQAKEYEAALTEINQSLRTEVSSDDVYVRRMRPTFGYLMAVTWAVQMLGLAYVITFETDKAPSVLGSMESLSTVWAVGLSVLGIYVYKRSEEKKVAPTYTSAPKVQLAPLVKTTNVAPSVGTTQYNN